MNHLFLYIAIVFFAFLLAYTVHVLGLYMAHAVRKNPIESGWVLIHGFVFTALGILGFICLSFAFSW